MESKNIIPCLLVCVVFGYFAISSLYGVGRLITLKKSNEMVSGSIDKVNMMSTGRYLSYTITCSLTYKDQYYNIELAVTDIFPFVGSVYKDYPVGNTTFLVNNDYGIAFPWNNINMELRRRLFHAIFLIIVIIFTIKVYSIKGKEKDTGTVKYTSNKRCRKCNTVFNIYDNKCPNCGSSLYEETNQELSINLSQITPFGEPIPNDKTLDVNTQFESMHKDNITDDKKNEEIERLEKLFDSSTDENEKGIIAKKLYELGKMYYWRFIPRDKLL